uniref:Gamma-interferon-inducible lysosomal thiol reductase-like n=1 Tax=Hirondellea gigas TaxID=1518452 RepID=A0A2P2I298_9CRUS
MGANKFVVLMLLLLSATANASLFPMFFGGLLMDYYPIWMTPRVKLEVYMETMCPDCRGFFHEQLAPTWKQLRSIMDVEIYPYGNAKETPLSGGGYNFTCQNGPLECQGNMMLACAQKYIHNNPTFVDYSICVMEDSKTPIRTGKKCAEQLNVDFDPILMCSLSREGDEVLHEVAVATDNLQPKHTYVPWMVINNIHTEEIQSAALSDLKKYICGVYTGAPPSACL